MLEHAGLVQPVRDGRVEARARPVVQQLHVPIDHLVVEPRGQVAGSFQAGQVAPRQLQSAIPTTPVTVVGQLLIRVAGFQHGESLSQLGL